MAVSLFPWIDAGVVEIIRTPADFDPKLNWESLVRQRKKFEANETLAKAAEITSEEIAERHMENMANEMLILGAPDSYLEGLIKKLGLESDEFTAKLGFK